MAPPARATGDTQRDRAQYGPVWKVAHLYLIVDLANHHADAADAVVLLPA